MEEKEIKRLLDRYRDGKCTESERIQVERYFTHYIKENDALPDIDAWKEAKTSMRASVFEVINRSSRPSNYRWWASAAAVLFLGFALGYFYWHQKGSSFKQTIMVRTQTDIDPGKDVAILTLADGSKIILDEAANGDLANDENVQITKADDGQLIYKFKGNRATEADGNKRRETYSDKQIGYHTIETPRGGQYKLVLPDGSSVWLNAASILRFPVQFDGGRRTVELSGEAYFEIEHAGRSRGDNLGPFVVKSAGQEVQVLGTHFNVNAYSDEPTLKTTLLKGAVRVWNELSNQSQVLIPGEQSNLEGKMLSKKKVDIETSVAWKNRLFIFHHVDLPTMLRQIERWYDVQFVYESLPNTGSMYGEISRDKKLSVVLDALEENTGLKFIIEGRRVIVKK
ncbi:FecR family protein [Olivibacter sitiensis]|uniref:FecR family protein n=1 Tax=Olivibacter sitiensis TaxID=376470 RepID=UPI00056758E3|nr:FecR family protein [Olivibacter sitiensis]